MSNLNLQQEQTLLAQIAQANEKIVTLENRLRILDGEFASHLNQRPQYQLLDEVCTSLDKLNQMGTAHLFWGALSAGADTEQQLQRVRAAVAEFQKKTAAVEKLRSALQSNIKDESAAVALLNNRLADLRKTEKNRTAQLQRQAREMSERRSAMPWSRQGTDEQRYRKILFTLLSFAIAFGGVVPIFRSPVDHSMGMVVPERIARIIKKKQEAKPVVEQPPEKLAEKKDEKVPEEKTPDKKPPKDTPKPVATDAKTARKSAESKGVLAFKNNFADLMADSAPLKMGASARISNNANRATGPTPQRSIIVSQATGGSGGINTATLSRQSETNVGQRITSAEVKFARVESAASVEASAADRPLSKGGTASRTDEEIQIVFDRYKSALYRIYNRELRNNPTLRGKVVLRIVIEPDGRVSACTVKSTNMDSPTLSADIVDRVLKFNFGVKEGVPAITILYPIDFLPAT